MGQVTVAFKMPIYNVQVRVAEDLAKPVETSDPSGDLQPGKEGSDQQSSSMIKKEEIHKIIDDQRKTVEKMTVEETNDGRQKVTILVAPAPILRSQPQQPAAAAPAPAPAAAQATPSVMPKPSSPAPVSMASAKKNKEVKTASAFKLPDAFMKAMGY